MPIVGGLSCKTGGERELLLGAQEVLFLSGRDGDNYRIHNLHEKGTINFLHIAFRQQSPAESFSLRLPFRLEQQNMQVSIGLEKTLHNAYGCAALYSGREKGSYKMKDINNHVLALVINGAFEVADRLLEHRDILAIGGQAELYFQSHSDAAILLLLELPVY